jgi:AraC-like DNA-binding protein
VEFGPGYVEFSPPAAMRGALACLWVRVPEPDGGERPRAVLPDACVDIVWTAGLGAVLAGPDTGPAPADAERRSVIVGARFAPGAGGAALGMPLAAIRDERVPLAELWPALDRELPADLDPRTALRRVGAVAARLVATAPPDRAVHEAARRLADPRTRVERLAADLGLSDRQLRRRCDTAVGYGPKLLQRVLRFRRFLARADTDADLARLAAELGYADQAHLTRECTRLAGMPPAALIRARAAGG